MNESMYWPPYLDRPKSNIKCEFCEWLKSDKIDRLKYDDNGNDKEILIKYCPACGKKI